jgi:hypothetical protein
MRGKRIAGKTLRKMVQRRALKSNVLTAYW